MGRIVEFPLEAGGSLFVETSESQTSYVPRGLPSDAVDRSAETFEAALASVHAAASAVLGSMQGLAQRPDAIEVQFGVKLSGKIGAVLSSVSGEAHFTVCLRWTSASSGTNHDGR